MQHLSVTTHLDRDLHVISLVGEIDLISGPLITDAVKEALAAGTPAQIVVDLSRTSFLDSSGIAALLAARRAAEEHGGTLRVTAAGGLVKQVLEMTGVWEHLSGERGS